MTDELLDTVLTMHANKDPLGQFQVKRPYQNEASFVKKKIGSCSIEENLSVSISSKNDKIIIYFLGFQDKISLFEFDKHQLQLIFAVIGLKMIC